MICVSLIAIKKGLTRPNEFVEVERVSACFGRITGLYTPPGIALKQRTLLALWRSRNGKAVQYCIGSGRRLGVGKGALIGKHGK